MVADTTREASLDQAIALHQAGAIAQAETIYRTLLKKNPEDPDALNLLGLLLQDRGQHDEAVAVLQHAIEVDPEFPEALTNLARVRLTLGDVEQAAQDAAAAISFDPELPEAHLQFGRVALEQKKPREAENAFRQCIALEPLMQDAHLFLGLCLAAQSKGDDALEAFSTAARTQPLTPAALIRAGSALSAINRLDDALTLHDQAVARAPDLAAAHVALALTLRRRAEPSESAEACRHALALDSGLADVWLLLASNLSSLGRFAEAADCQRKVLALDPHNAEALRDLTQIELARGDVTDAAPLTAVLSDPAARESEKIAAGFCLGGLLEMQQAYDAAFDAYAEANKRICDRMEREGQGFQPKRFNLTLNWLIRTFSTDYFAGGIEPGSRSDAPVFIVGAPRSGTTLIEQILASHPAVFGGGERNDIGEIIQRLDGGPAIRSPAEWNRTEAVQAAEAYIGRMRAKAGGALRFTDKLPDNILALGQIATLFPNARVIFCRRDPRDTCLSVFFQQFAENIAWAYDLDGCAERILQVERLTDHWRRTLPLRMLHVEYETLVRDLEGHSRRMVAFLGLPWDPACLSFHQTDRAVMTASYWQVRQPIYTKSVGRWHHYAKQLAPLLPALTAASDADAPPANTATLLPLAERHALTGRSAVAEAIYTAVLRDDPEQPDALHGEGICRLLHGNNDDAVMLLRRATMAKPTSVAWYTDLATASLAAGKAHDASVAANQAIGLDPESADAWLALGHAATAKADWPEAVRALQLASQLKPDSPTILAALATALLERGAVPDALVVWQQVLAIEPEHVEGLIGLAATHALMKSPERALETLNQVLLANPRIAELRFKIAMVYFWLQMPEAAAEQARIAVSLSPGLTLLWVLLGDMLSLSGDLDGACVAFDKALALDPHSGGALAGLLQSGRPVDLQDIARRADVRAHDETASTVSRIAAAFALGDARHKSKAYDEAFEAYALAKHLVRTSRFEPDASRVLIDLQKMLDWTRESFSEDTFLTGPSIGNLSNMPVFIVGMPRSGTSLIEQILASHRSVAGLGEASDIPDILGMNQPLLHPNNWDVRDMQRKTTALLERHAANYPTALRVVDKMPDNVKVLGQIALMFPRSQVIVSRRDLRDVCWSCLTQNFSEFDMMWADTQEECAARTRLIEQFIDFWLEILPLSILEVNYEDLVADLEGQTRRLIDFIGLPWDQNCLEFYKTARTVKTASAWQVRKPLYGSSVGRWRPYRKHLWPLLEGLKGLVPDED